MNASSARAPGPAFLSDLAGDGPLTQTVALVVAHPDDEAIGAGGQLHRLQNLTLAVASDGAPRDGRDMRRLGFETPKAYAQARRDELAAALGAAGLAHVSPLHLDLPDGELVFALEHLIGSLATTFQREKIEIVLTHAYEGGHPDHDALALAAHFAARRCARPPVVIEMPYYRADAQQGWAFQSFVTCEPAPLRIALSGDRWTRKCAMIDAHRSQADLLCDFRQPVEQFRIAPQQDFTKLPNGGRLLYAQVAPNLSADLWLSQARAAIAKEDA